MVHPAYAQVGLAFQYFVYGKQAQVDAKPKFGYNVVQTSHSMALKHMKANPEYDPALKNLSDIKNTAVIATLKIEQLVTKRIKEDMPQGQTFDASWRKKRNKGIAHVTKALIKTLDRFFWSKDKEIGSKHLHFSAKESWEPQGKNGWKPPFTETWYVNTAKRLWTQVKQGPVQNGPNGPKSNKDQLCMPHDGYLKLYQLADINITDSAHEQKKITHIMIDEAQDFSACQVDAFITQPAKHGAIVYIIGDRRQRIYSWRGASEDFENYNVQKEFALTTSFRFGREVAKVATLILQHGSQKSHQLKGHEPIADEIFTTEALEDADRSEKITVVCRPLAGMKSGENKKNK